MSVDIAKASAIDQKLRAELQAIKQIQQGEAPSLACIRMLRGALLIMQVSEEIEMPQTDVSGLQILRTIRQPNPG